MVTEREREENWKKKKDLVREIEMKTMSRGKVSVDLSKSLDIGPLRPRDVRNRLQITDEVLTDKWRAITYSCGLDKRNGTAEFEERKRRRKDPARTKRNGMKRKRTATRN